MAICILGTPNAGSDIIARLLTRCGLKSELKDSDNTLNPADLSRLNNRIFRELGSPWYNLPEIKPGWSNTPGFDKLKTEIQAVVSNQPKLESFIWQDIRIGLTLEFWLKIFPESKLILCLRNPVEVAKSMSSDKDTVHNLNYNESLTFWQQYHETLLQTVSPKRLIVTHYETYFYNPEAELKRILSLLDIQVSDDQIKRVIKAKPLKPERYTFPSQIIKPKFFDPQLVRSYNRLLLHTGAVYQEMIEDTNYQLIAQEKKIIRLYAEHQTTLRNLENEIDSLKQKQADTLNLLRDQFHAELDKVKSSLQEEFEYLISIIQQETTPGENQWKSLQQLPNQQMLVTQQRWYQSLRTGLAIAYRNGPIDLFRRTYKRLNRQTFSGTTRSPYPIIDSAYAAYVAHVEPSDRDFEQQIVLAESWTDKSLFTIVTPVYNPSLPVFKETLQSVLNQTYNNWEWCVVDASSDNTIWEYLSKIVPQEARIRPIRVETNQGIAANTNIALEQAHGKYIVLLDHDDVLAPHALFEVANAIRENPNLDLIYSDEDKLDEQGNRCDPLFKPAWSPEMMLCVNVVTHLCVFRRSLLDTIGLLDPEMDGTQDWDFFLRISEHTSQIHRIPKMLYHWRKTHQSTAQKVENKAVQAAQKSALESHFKRLGLANPKTTFAADGSMHSIYPLSTWDQHKPRKISIIIASVTNLSTLLKLTSYPDFEVIVVNADSTETFDDPRLKHVTTTESFNLSKVYNLGADHANGDLLLFLDQHIEVLHNDWLDLMAQWFELEGVGIVGPKIVSSTGKIQHAGVMIDGDDDLASHIFINATENTFSLFGTEAWYRNLSAVTGHCLMISRSVFETVGQFDEDYQHHYGDIDLCLRVREAGYRIVYTPHVRVMNHTTTTRQTSGLDFERARTRWSNTTDPYYHPNLHLDNGIPQLKWPK